MFISHQIHADYWQFCHRWRPFCMLYIEFLYNHWRKKMEAVFLLIFGLYISGKNINSKSTWTWHRNIHKHIVASELKDPIWHSLEWQIGSFSSEATIYYKQLLPTGFAGQCGVVSIQIHCKIIKYTLKNSLIAYTLAIKTEDWISLNYQYM